MKFRVYDEKRRVWDTEPILFYPGEEIKKQGRIIQFSTGLVDKNNKEIYGGDILNQVLDNKPCYYIVEWGNQPDYCGFVLRPLMKRDGTFRMTVHDFKIYLAEGFEIIGNIFDNPELLK